jgi:hypothetical protein
MNDFFQTLKDAFPILRNHPVLMARIALIAIILVGLYAAKGLRKRFCLPLYSKLCDKIFSTNRWLRVYQRGSDMGNWRYYTSEVTGKGHAGDDIIWTLVHWPSLKPKDSFKVVGAVGMVDGIYESQAKLLSRWEIMHDPDGPFIGGLPARGLKSLLRRAAAKVLWALASI